MTPMELFLKWLPTDTNEADFFADLAKVIASQKPFQRERGCTANGGGWHTAGIKDGKTFCLDCRQNF